MTTKNYNQEAGQTDKELKEPKKYQLKIDIDVFTVDKPQVTRIDILELANKNPSCRFEVYQEINPHKQLVLLGDGQVADLSQPGIEKFVTKFLTEVTYHLSDEPFTTAELVLTPDQILTKKFGDNANQYYLKQIVGQSQISYEGKPNQPITMCPDLRFIAIFTGAMTVS